MDHVALTGKAWDTVEIARLAFCAHEKEHGC
jgi:hypothetical protein